jgi:DNA sulfur modification protein DndB
MKDNISRTFPALRCHMGDWVYYVTFMNLSDIASWIKRTDQIHKNERLRDMIQRELTDRVVPIADYLIEQKERFFNAIVVGVYGGSPEWYPLEIGDSPILGVPDIDEESRNSIGLLMLNGEEKLFAIDGQHRVEAIKIALRSNPELKKEDQSMIFVAHKTDEQGRTRTRRLFSTLNRYAKPVSKGEIIALDEDDAYAITTRRLVEDFSLLNKYVHFGKTAPLKANDDSNLTSILALYDITQIVYVPDEKKFSEDEKKQLPKLKIRRPSDSILVDIYAYQTSYWNYLKENIEEYNELFQSNPEDKIAGKYRTKYGGHLMFRPLGQQTFARAVRVMVERGIDLKQAIAALSRVPMELSAEPWIFVLWNPGTSRVNSTISKVLVESLFLHLVGHFPKNRNYDLLEQYRKVMNNPEAELLKPVN